MRLFQPFVTPTLSLINRIVMSPMTRSRATERGIPNALMSTYYGQRAEAGLIITEGTSPSPNGLGYPRIPGLYNGAHALGWKRVTDIVHLRGGKIFVQLMHTGRVGHVGNLPAGAEVVGPTAVAVSGQMYVDGLGQQPHTPPRPMTEADIVRAVAEYAQSARLAIEAGFDGVELHAANGYLIEQFLNANVNTRTDAWGGSAEARNRFALEVARAVVRAVGAHRVGVRVSPYGAFNDTGPFDGVEPQYLALARMLGELHVAYLHLVDHSSMGAPEVPAGFKAALRQSFKGLFIASGGFDRDRAEAALQRGEADLVAFGRPFISNPDLVARMRIGAPLAAPDFGTFYTPGEKGYIDYPRFAGLAEA
jgi:N-ethylmaleimide reductase